MIYLDNAASSWPKPDSVLSAMERCIRDHGANPGRSGHSLSIQAGRVVYEARDRVASLFGFDDPLAVVFTKNATEALNLALIGLLRTGDHVITSVMEHNSVLRPLRYLEEEEGVAVSRLTCSKEGILDPADVDRAIDSRTKLVVLSHASNVTGTICDIAEVGRIARDHELLFCVDAAQTAGCRHIDMESMGIDLLAFTGHKTLYGPQGTGGLCIGRRARGRLRPLIHGGTGSLSDSDMQPDFLPDRFEAGTLNTVGLAGLTSGIEFIQERGLEAIESEGAKLTLRLVDGLREIPGLSIYGPADPRLRTPVVSFNLEGKSCSDVALALEERACICCRVGLHCAPMAHRLLGTFPDGAVRFSMSMFNTEEEIDTTLSVLAELSREPN